MSEERRTESEAIESSTGPALAAVEGAGEESAAEPAVVVPGEGEGVATEAGAGAVPSEVRGAPVGSGRDAEAEEEHEPVRGAEVIAGVTGLEIAAARDEMALGGGEGEPGIGGAAASPEKLLRTREVVTELCRRIGAEVAVEVRDSAEGIACSLQVRSGGEVFQMAPRGQVLEALQYLANRIVNRDSDQRKWIVLDIGTLREVKVDPAMVEMSRRLGEAARRIGKPLTVVPIQARDRRVIHQTLSEMEGVRTHSEGEGILRRLIVEPVGEKED